VSEPLLAVKKLRTSFPIGSNAFVHAVDNVSFDIRKGEAVALVGESGSGKTVTAMSIMRLVAPPGRITGGEVLFKGHDLASMPERQLRDIRGNDIAMVFQEPMTSLNPVFKIGDQVSEAIRIHRKVSRKEARKRAGEMLELVSIPDPIKRLDDYPHQLSGGMRQRVMIAMALSCDPELLIADEPTTALDVTIQAQIMELLASLQKRLGLAILLITHDLGVVAEMAQRVVVMYAGRKVEEAPVNEIFARPLHPYTRGLLGAVPKLGSSLDEGGRTKLAEIAGLVPSLRKPIIGCPFAGRCTMVTDLCRSVAPAIEAKAPGHSVACHYAGQKVAA
jgi:peptide/nickel transport system ATP-binding protein